MKRPPLKQLTLGLVLLAGVALRLFRLGAESLWYDETVSVLLAGSPLPELIRHTAGDIHPPGYYVLLRGWLILAGFPTGHADPSSTGLEFASGFFSLFFGVLLIPLVYVLARRLADRRTGLIAAALISFSPYNLWYSQEVRMYTLGAGLGALATYALWRINESANLESANLESANLESANLESANLESANLESANLESTNLESANLESANLESANLESANLESANLESRRRGLPTAAWWIVYAFAAAAGMYTLYYFIFLLVPLNLWVLWRMAAPEGTFRGGRRQMENRGWKMEDGRWKSETAGSNQHPAPSIQLPASDTQLPASSTQHPASSFQFVAWLLANGLAVLLYAPWLPIAWRQATNPPVPPWRTPPDILSALVESWNALSLGQSAPTWLWPVLVLTLALYGLGLVALHGHKRISESANLESANFESANPESANFESANPESANFESANPESANFESRISNQRSAVSYLPLATFGPLALILLASLITPLYHVRYLFTYSPAFYAVLAAGLAWLLGRSRLVFGTGFGVLLVASAVSAHAFWFDPLWRGDDHCGAVRFLQERWRPGDVVLVNAGWTYTALMTYWDGPIAHRSRLTAPLPEPRADDALIMVTTGHLDGDPGLGWADPRSDFFALPGETAQRQLMALFGRFDRIWHYRIYDTVNDPDGRIRSWLSEAGQLFEDQVFAGEANMRVQGYLPRKTAAADPAWPKADFAPGLTVHIGPLPPQIAGGETLYPLLLWAPATRLEDFATSVRLVAADGTTWAQGRDERPAGALYPASRWPIGATVRQRPALPVLQGTPPGDYFVELVVYDPATGQPWPAQNATSATTPGAVRLGEVIVARPEARPTLKRPLARFGPLALVEATSPVTTIARGGQIPVGLLWQAAEAPGEPLVVVVQLLDGRGRPAASLEEQPTAGRYPTQAWIAGELVRDRHLLSLPADLAPGSYRLIVGVYRATDRTRFTTRVGLFGTRDYWTVKRISVQPAAE